MSIFDRFFVKSSSRNTTPVRKRQLRLETLENRELLSVSTADFAAIRSDHTNLNLSASISDYNVIEITANELSDAKLRAAIAEAGTTTENDLIVLRTTATQNKITLSGTELSIDFDAPSWGSVTIVGLGTNSLTLNANQQSRNFYIGSNAKAGLAGLTITDGYSYSSSGGGICNYGTLTVMNSTITENSANANHGFGGGIYNYGTLTATNSTITGNSAYSGGGIDNEGILTITNSTITGNDASFYGGGIDSLAGTLMVANSTITRNDAFYGGGIFNGEATSTLYNTIVAENSMDIYCSSGTIQGFNNLTSFTDWSGSSGSNFVYDSSKPLFVDAAQSDYRLAANSQAIDKGSNSYVPSGLTKDLAGNTRIQGGIVDIGAYEYQQSTTLGVPQVNISQSNGNVTLSWVAIPTATHYGIYRMVNGKWSVVNANVTTTTFTENNVPEGLQTYAVRAFKGTAMSDYQQGVTINVVAGLGVPQVTPTQTNGKVTLTWLAITDADRYCVYRLVNGKWTSLGYVTATTFTESTALTGLQTYAVRAFKGTTMSDYQQGVTIIL